MEALMVEVEEELGQAVACVMMAEPDYIVMGMSSETFLCDMAGYRQLVS